ncbi:hypothetical protein PIROE2DRAFT_57465 [Piromyces sp. E2]|nr:hypothetical protein PIROE2DRAFT_57465 [Piromyces sp. E2]|eukprot:OUM69422.1 hypothetical protein PIROE2DRAFT_57465 [Piromyces sp. E2]
MDFNDIFKFDEIVNDNDINNIELDEKINKKLIPDNSSDKTIDNSTNKIVIPQNEQYDLNNNNNNMLLDMSDITINTAIESLSEIPFDNSVDSNVLLSNSNKKMQNIYDSVALKTEPNTLYPQLYPTEEYPMEEEQDTFAQYMNYSNANVNMNNIPYPLYYNNAYNQDEALSFNADFLNYNYNSDFDINGMNSYYPFASDIDMEDIDMDAYSLISNAASSNQELALNENEIKAAINEQLINQSNEIENKMSKNINIMNSLTNNVVSPLPYNKSLNNSTPKIPFNSNSLIVPSNDENEVAINDIFKYIYPLNNKNKLLSNNIKNNMDFEDLISIDTLTQQINLSDNIVKKSLMNNKVNPINNLNMDLNEEEFTPNINTIYSTPIEKPKPKSETELLKEDLLNSIKDMNKLLDFDFSSLDNVLDDDFVKMKTSPSTNKNDSKSKQTMDGKSLSSPKLIPSNENVSNESSKEPINDYKNLINSLNVQNKDSTDNLLKMFITSPKLNIPKKITDNDTPTMTNTIKDNNLSEKILVDKTIVGSPSINIPSSPSIPDLLKEIKEKNKNITRSSSMPQLSNLSISKEPSTSIQHKLINKSKPILKTHSIISNFNSNAQKVLPLILIQP